MTAGAPGCVNVSLNVGYGWNAWCHQASNQLSRYLTSGKIRCSIDLERLSSWVAELCTRSTGCYQELQRLGSSLYTSTQLLHFFLMLSYPPVRSGTSSIAAEILDVNSAGWHMFTYNIHEAAGPSWRPSSTHLPDTEPAPSQLKYLMLAQLVSRCWDVTSM